MFAVLAAACFLLALFGVHLGAVNLLVLGLLFLAVHLIFDFRPWAGRGRP